jgi:hypothetical protein
VPLEKVRQAGATVVVVGEGKAPRRTAAPRRARKLVVGGPLMAANRLASPSYSSFWAARDTLRGENGYDHSPPVAGWTAFQIISVRRLGLISRGSDRASARSLTLAAGSECQATRGTARHPDSWRRTPA